jgi:RimJ/RimL family protein N-acetyltransferase
VLVPRPFHQIVLQGNHVRLEPLDASHLDGMIAAAAGPRDTFTYTLVPRPDAEDVDRYLHVAVEQHARGEGLAFAVVRLATGAVVGSTRFMNAEYWDWDGTGATDANESDAVEIGSTWLAASAQRTGVNTEMKLLMLAHAFDVLGVRRVTLKTDARNRRSRDNIERVGATFEGVLRAHMPAMDGGIRDSAWYSILDSEWPAVRGRLTARLRPPN